MEHLKDKLLKINTFIFDFDGVLSDGKVYTMADGEQVRATNVKDGYALHYALTKGYNIAIISGGYAQSIPLRFKTFPGIEIYMRVRDKIAKFNEYLADHHLTNEQVLVMGDDIPDYPMLQLAAVKCCPQDASEEIKAIVDYISPRNGGNGAVRDVIERVLKAQGKWMNEDAFIW